MTSATIPGLEGDSVPTKHAQLVEWVREVAELTQPDRVCGPMARTPNGIA